MLHNFFAREEGQGLVEYALILLLIAVAVVTALTALGLQLSDTYDLITGSFP